MIGQIWRGGIAIFRTIQALKLRGFSDFTLITPPKGKKGADLRCAKEGKLICVEVKAITKQSKPRQGRYLEDQLYEKIGESAEKAARQLRASEDELSCSIKILAPVFNSFDQTIYLDESDLNRIANRLQESGDVPSIDVFDGIFFINKMGNDFLFFKQVRPSHLAGRLTVLLTPRSRCKRPGEKPRSRKFWGPANTPVAQASGGTGKESGSVFVWGLVERVRVGG